jgi:hypothetical protein
MGWMGADSFRSVDRLLMRSAPEAAPYVKALGPDAARKFLRYQVSEQNRAGFVNWETAQIFYGMAFFFYLLFLTKEGKVPMSLVLLMLLVVMVQRFMLTPELIATGRNLDFAPLDSMATERNQFWVLHSAYMGSEVLKGGVGLALALKLAFAPRGRSGDSRKKLDPIDKRDHRHVNR